MDSRPLPAQATEAAPLTAYARIERIAEPWSLNRTFAILVTLCLAVLFGSWIASGQFENLILFAVWFVAAGIIVFVQDYWWSPPLIISALTLSTTAAGFVMTGMELGVVILALTFPMKMAMKTLRKAEPEMDPGFFYWALLGFVLVHAVVILFYNRIAGVQLRNIAKCYYQVLTPLVFFGMMNRYCYARTIRPTVVILFFINVLGVVVSSISLLRGVSLDAMTDLQITIGWLDHYGAMGVARYASPFLFAGSLAFWPAVRNRSSRFMLAMGAVVGFFGVLIGSGRQSLIFCIVAALFFAIVRNKLWLAFPVILLTLLTAGVISVKPEFYQSLPYLMQRTLAPFNFSSGAVEIHEELEGSDNWHQELRDRSFDYWLADTNSFWLGHGFKSWDTTITADNQDFVDHEHMVQLAIEMGATENMFSSVTNVFGLTGILLYAGFLCQLGRSLYKAYRLTPLGSDARALCEFSMVTLAPAIVLCAYTGGVPLSSLTYWQLGLLAARPYLGSKKIASDSEEAAAEIPTFARPAFAQQASRSPRVLPSRRPAT